MLRLRFSLYLLPVILAFSGSVRAQEMNGFVHSNYSGITGSLINPTSILNSKLYLDINLVGLHLNVDNNYIFLAKDEYRFSRFLEPDPVFPEHIEEVSGDSRNFYDLYNTDHKNAFSQVRVMGPSAMFALGSQAFGISTGYRVLASGHRIPYDLAKFAVEGLDYYPQQRINYINQNDFRAAAMAFAEVSGTWSAIIYRRNREHWTAGITLKGLFGTGGAYGYADNIDYVIPNSDTIIVNNVNGSLGMSLPVDYNNNDVLLPDNLIQGSGFGVDLGLTYQKKLQGHSTKLYSAPCEIPYQPYLFRLGISLLDLGRVTFRKNTQWMEMEDASANWYDVKDNDYNSLNDLFRTISYEFSGDSTRLIDESSFSVSLPTAVSLQADFKVINDFYVNSSLVHPVVLQDAAVVRPSQLSVTPRYENRFFEVAVPFTLYNYRYPRLGLSARFYRFIIGTDKLGGFFGMNDFKGLDLYIMVKLQFERGNCRNFNKKYGCGNLEYLQQY